MRPDVVIVGQGLAGSLLGWELERAGIAFAVVDRGPALAASFAAGAGIVNPITGRRLVKTWRAEALVPAARATYREIGDALGVALWHDVRIRRFFADEREAAAYAAKRATGELAPFDGGPAEGGFWIESAGRVELPALLGGLRERWRARGWLREADGAEALRATDAATATIDCRGLAGAREGEFGFVPWTFSKGEVLHVATARALDPGVVLNRRHWVAATSAHAAWVGATHEPGVVDPAPSVAARATLEASVRGLIEGDFAVTEARAGVRVTLPEKLPVAGWHPGRPRLGLANGLGAKGVAWAPLLARQWVEVLQRGGGFDAAIDVRRFAR